MDEPEKLSQAQFLPSCKVSAILVERLLRVRARVPEMEFVDVDLGQCPAAQTPGPGTHILIFKICNFAKTLGKKLPFKTQNTACFCNHIIGYCWHDMAV
jgi:hypothetical protein